MSALAEGVFCLDCCYFEDGDEVDEARCMACGCPAGQHVRAHVVEVS